MIQKPFIVLTVAIGFIALGAAYEVCAPGESGTFHRDYSSCRGYLTCYNGKSIPGKCASEYLFNEAKSSCDHPRNVKCTLVCPASGSSTFRLPGSCSKYISCLHGKAMHMECPIGELFDEKSSACQPMHEVDCPLANKYCPDPRVTNTFASKDKCSSYYVCVNGLPKRKECEDGLHYDSASQSCDLPAVARCPIVGNKKEHFNDIEIECPTEGTHFLPHPLNCHLYHICHKGELTKMMCGRGLYYDMDTKRCALAKNARCIVDALKQRPVVKNADTVTTKPTTTKP